MSKTKKVVSLVLAMTMILCVFSVSVFAADDTSKTTTWSIASTAAGTAPAVGTDIVVAVSLTTDYAVGQIGFSLNYDTAKLTYKSAAVGAGYPASYGTNPHFTINGSVGGAGIVSGTIVPNTAGFSTAVPAVSLTNAVVVNVTFTVKATGATTVSINKDVKNDANIDGELYVTRSLSGNINVLGDGFAYGQTAAYGTDSLSFGASAPSVPELAVAAGKGGVIDASKADGTYAGYVYGIEINDGETADTVFEATNGGSVNVVANSESLTEATGATLQLLDADGDVVEEYIIIIFGDVNGDGGIDSLDSIYLQEWEMFISAYDNEYQYFAGDVNFDGSSDSLDGIFIEENEMFISALNTQVDIATAVRALSA